MKNVPQRENSGNVNVAPTFDTRAKDAYWAVVADCLGRFHNADEAESHRLALQLRSQIESPPCGIDGELFYHEEPFYVACDLAGKHDTREKDRLLSKHRKQYDAILALRNW